MNYKKYTAIFALVMLGIASCTDESLFPLPYNDRQVGSFLRMYRVTATRFDFDDITVNAGANTAFETVFEAVDDAGGSKVNKIDFYVTMRRGTTATDEVLVKSIQGSAFTAVPEPTYSEYRRTTVKITAQEAIAALATLTTVPATNPWPSGLTAVAYPGSLAVGDQLVFRWVLTHTDGRVMQVTNVQSTNAALNNYTANITTGQFYSSPFIFTMPVSTYRVGFNTGDWTGTYNVTQRAIWSPAHSVFLHQQAYPDYLNKVLFPNQAVTLAKPATGLSSEREFTISYKGSNVTMRVNFEPLNPGLSAAVVSNLNTLLGFTGATTGNLGTVLIPIQSTKVQCSSNRELFWVTPTTGTFAGTAALKPGLPQFTYPNRGVYRTDIAGTAAGDTFSISVDDDCDEYGRRNGYCSWTRRVYLTFTHQ